MEAIAAVVSALWAAFAGGNFAGLAPADRLEGVKLIAGFTAGLASAPQRAGMGFIPGKVAGIPESKLPTSPTNVATGLINWQIDTGRAIADALAGDTAAADRAVGNVHRLGDYMAGQGDD